MSADVYRIYTDKILAELKNGVAPWLKPWHTGYAGMPRNLQSGRPYRGANILQLVFAPYTAPYWTTFKAAAQMIPGERVLKGPEKQHPTMVVLWKTFDKRNQETGEMEKGFYLRYYNVFNVEQTNIPESMWPQTEAKPVGDLTVNEDAEIFVGGYLEMLDGPTLAHGGGRACYNMGTDHVQMPPRDSFPRHQSYYHTLFHEMVHSTRHPKRLHREGGEVDQAHYAREELVAEMGAAFLAAECNLIDTEIKPTASYLDHWMKVIQADEKILIQAAGRAQKAVDWIVGRDFAQDPDESPAVAA